MKRQQHFSPQPDFFMGLKATIESSGADVVINASPANNAELLELSLPVAQVRYGFVPREGVDISSRVAGLLTA